MSKKNCRGMTLIEVLVTLVLLSVGLLGLAAMQVRAMQMNQGAYMRSQAVSLSQDMADRMRINWEAAEGGSYEITLAAESDDFIADDSDADQLKLVMQDISEWLAFIKASLPEGNGSISRTDQRFTITVCWDDSRGQGIQLSELACGANGIEFNEIEVTL
ncbi:MAG: type IV pilus modification protein PilV [Amphritea sp.]